MCTIDPGDSIIGVGSLPTGSNGWRIDRGVQMTGNNTRVIDFDIVRMSDGICTIGRGVRVLGTSGRTIDLADVAAGRGESKMRCGDEALDGGGLITGCNSCSRRSNGCASHHDGACIDAGEIIGGCGDLMGDGNARLTRSGVCLPHDSTDTRRINDCMAHDNVDTIATDVCVTRNNKSTIRRGVCMTRSNTRDIDRNFLRRTTTRWTRTHAGTKDARILREGSRASETHAR
jgi:hypothetical protein